MTETEQSTREWMPPDQPQTWYFTFGVGIDQPHRNNYYVVKDATYDQARARMVEVFGREWAFQYDDADWFKHGISQAEKYGLTEIA